jgi:hypothetical protein
MFRLELGLSNNSPYTGRISTLDPPATINVADFEFATVLDYAFYRGPQDQYTVNQILVGKVNSVTVSATPLPSALPLFGSGVVVLAGLAWRSRGKVFG